VAPDDTAREQHRTAGPRSLLEEAGPEAELPRPRGTDEPGHAGTGDQHQQAYVSENVGLCSTYSTRTRSGPHRKTATVLAASTTSSISTPRSSRGGDVLVCRVDEHGKVVEKRLFGRAGLAGLELDPRAADLDPRAA